MGADENIRTTLIGLKRGKPEALEEIMARYAGQVYHFALNLVKSESLAEELSQDVFVRIWNSRTSIEPDRNFQGFMYTIARNVCLNYLKSAAGQARVRTSYLEGEITHHLNPEQILISRQEYQILQEAIESLSPRRKTIFNLSRREGLSHQQIAEKLGITVNTVKVSMTKATAHIRSYLMKHPDFTAYLSILLPLLRH